VDVEPASAIERSSRNELSVGDGHDRLDLRIEVLAEPLRLPDRDSQGFGGLLRRRRRYPATATARAVGLGHEIGDLVPLGEPLEHVCPERRRRGDGNARHGRP